MCTYALVAKTPSEILATPPPSPEAGMYLDLLRRCLTREIFNDEDLVFAPARGLTWKGRAIRRALGVVKHPRIVRLIHNPQRLEDKLEGVGWPRSAEVMCGSRRLEFLQKTLYAIEREGIDGDFFEGGCWRGGAVILMMAALRALRGQHRRLVWAADSFEGYPAPTANSSQDDKDLYEERAYFHVTRSEFEQNLERYGVHGPELRVLEGYFDKSLPAAPIERLALIRIDIDGYEGVRAILENLYPKLVPGGFVVVDDYLAIGARRAIDEYIAKHRLENELHTIPQKTLAKGMYFRRES